MKLTIEATSEIHVLDGVEVRLWRGTFALPRGGGLSVDVFVHRLQPRTLDEVKLAAFDLELVEKDRPLAHGILRPRGDA